MLYGLGLGTGASRPDGPSDTASDGVASTELSSPYPPDVRAPKKDEQRNEFDHRFEGCR